MWPRFNSGPVPYVGWVVVAPPLGSRGGAVVKVLALHQCGLGLIPALYHMWVEFVVGSRPCSEGFSPGSLVFLPPQKPTLPNSNSNWNQWDQEPPSGRSHCKFPLILFYLSEALTLKQGQTTTPGTLCPTLCQQS